MRDSYAGILGLLLLGCEPNPDFDLASTLEPEGTSVVPTSGSNGMSTDSTTDSTTEEPSTGGPSTGGDGTPLGDVCAPLAAPEGDVVTVTPGDAAGLGQIIRDAAEGTTFSFEPGTYELPDGVWIEKRGVTLRSSTGNAADVILDGGFTSGSLLSLASPDITVADMTLQRSDGHLIHVTASNGIANTGALIYRLRLINPGLAAVRMNMNTEPADAGVVACSMITLTDARRDAISDDACQSASGVTAYGVANWTIRDNDISGFWCKAGFGGPGVSFSETSFDNVIERNVIRDAQFGIRFGVAEEDEPRREVPDPPCTDGYYGHYRGVIRDNMISATATGLATSEQGFDSGIALWQVCDASVVHNTVASAVGEFSSIEYRFDRTTAKILNNLVTGEIIIRDDAGAPVAGNVEMAPLSEFQDPLSGDLHLVSGSSMVDAGVNLGADGSPHDIDGEARVGTPDVGADEIAPF